MTNHSLTLPEREGQPPRINGPFPHRQVTQTAPRALQEELFRRAAALPGVAVAESLVSVPGARAFMLSEEHAKGFGPCDVTEMEVIWSLLMES